MEIKSVLLALLAISLISNIVSATPACTSAQDFLYNYEFRQNSDIMNFLDDGGMIYNKSFFYGRYFASCSAVNCSYYSWFRTMIIDEKYDNSTFKVAISDVKLFEDKLYTLKIIQQNKIYYTFPAETILQKLNEFYPNISDFGSKNLVLSLDDTILGEYAIEYRHTPANCGGSTPSIVGDIFIIGSVIFFIFALIIAPIILVIMLVLHIRNKRKLKKRA